MGNCFKKLSDKKVYQVMYLLNALLHLRKSMLCKSQTTDIIERICNLPREKLEIFVDDIHTAMEERLKVLE